MNRAAFVAAGLLGLGIAGAVTVEAPEPSASALAHGNTPVAASAAAAASEAPAPVAAPSDADGGAPTLLGFDDFGASADGGSFAPLPSLELPSSASKSVRFGVILVAHSAAQGAAAGARTKAAAQDLATRLAEQAKTDFKAAVASGDTGSMEDAGRIGRGVLEPESEMVLFQLESGAVSAPIDTPRGFWIVKRLD